MDVWTCGRVDVRTFTRSYLHTAGGVLLLLFLLLPPGTGWAQALPDTTAAATDTTTVEAFARDHSPRGAFWRSAVLPGWGQYYNRQYLKIPVVYLGLGGLVAAFLYTSDQYYLYRNAYRFRRVDGRMVSAEEYDGPYGGPTYERAYEELLARFGNLESLPSGPVRRRRDRLRRYRDLSIIVSSIFYLLQAAEAYVSAQLLDFDVGEDLSLHVAPRPHGAWAGLRVSL